MNIDAALSAIEPCSTGALNAGRCFRAIGCGGIDFGCINIVADTMDHRIHMGLLRMSVNYFATHSQEQTQLTERLFRREAEEFSVAAVNEDQNRAVAGNPDVADFAV